MKAKTIDLFTPSGERLAADRDRIPWDVYPRPTLRRDSYLCLNGWWDFTIAADGESFPIVYDKLIRVPYCPESLLSGVHEVPQKGNYLFYRRTFSLPEGFCKDRVLLHFGASDQVTFVWVNGVQVGSHVGGYTSFSMDITDYLAKENAIVVRVYDDLDSKFPYGKQKYKRGGMWYTPVSGIWQTVWLESVPVEYVRALDVVTDQNGATIYARGVIDGRVSVTTPDGVVECELCNGVARVDLSTPRLWSPEDPYLYEYTVTTTADAVSSYFAIRMLDTRVVNGVPRMCLNGKPIFFHAVLDQGYWSDGLFTPPLPTCYAWDAEKMQALGFNTLRKHIKIEAEQFYYDCDRLGMLVWQDMVSNGHYSFLRDTALPTIGMKKLCDKRLHRNILSRALFEQTMERTVHQLKKHPCIVGWTIFNEGWGQFDSQRMYQRLKELDDTRFVDTASGWFKGAESDVVSEHVYFKPYRFKAGEKPVFLSEFGGYSYKPEGHVFNETQTYGYRLFQDQVAYMDAVEQLYRDEIIPAVACGLCGAVYTQLSDVEDETNGLYSYDRRVCKVDEGRMRVIAEELKEEISR